MSCQKQCLSIRPPVYAWACCVLVLIGLTAGCASYEKYQPRCISPSAVEQQLNTVPERVESIQPCAHHASMLAEVGGVSLADGVTPDEAAFVAVVSNPSLRTLRDDRGIARSQIIEAGILPNPQFAYSSDSPSFGNTAGTRTADSESLSWDVSKLNPRASRIRSASLSADAVNLDIARQEWLVAQQARQAVYDLVALRQQIDKLQQAEDVLDKNLKLVEKAEREGNLTLVELSAATSSLLKKSRFKNIVQPSSTPIRDGHDGTGQTNSAAAGDVDRNGGSSSISWPCFLSEAERAVV